MELIRCAFSLRPERQEIKLHSDKGSLMQGVIMERIRTSYGETLHRSELKPYSQYLFCPKTGCPLWVVNTLTREAADEIWKHAGLDQLPSVHLSHNDWDIPVVQRQFTRLSEDDLLQQTFFGACPRSVKIQFMAPTAFKSQGSYLNYPTVRLLFQSLLNKFNAFSSTSSLELDRVLADIEQNTVITGYRLQSTRFGLEGIRIPSFLGSVTLRISGPQQLANLVYLLLQFGTYSGVGIKTAIGMGGIRIIERRDTQ